MKFNSRKLNVWQRMFYSYLKCPDCGSKQIKIDWPYEPGWKCKHCGFITWEKLPNE